MPKLNHLFLKFNNSFRGKSIDELKAITELPEIQKMINDVGKDETINRRGFTPSGVGGSSRRRLTPKGIIANALKMANRGASREEVAREFREALATALTSSFVNSMVNEVRDKRGQR